jgi:hypothetical protein
LGVLEFLLIFFHSVNFIFRPSLNREKNKVTYDNGVKHRKQTYRYIGSKHIFVLQEHKGGNKADQKSESACGDGKFNSVFYRAGKADKFGFCVSVVLFETRLDIPAYDTSAF